MKCTLHRKGGILYHASLVLKERFSVRIKEGKGTACYYFDKTINRIIFYTQLSELLDLCFKASGAVNDKLFTAGLKQVLRHEVGHAMYTTRDKSFIHELKKEGIPFSLFNLFEDCRIEYKLVQDYKYMGLFYWFKYISSRSVFSTPADCLLHLKMCEAGSRVERAKTLKLQRFFPKEKQVKCVATRKQFNQLKQVVCIKFYYNIIRLADGDNEGMLRLLMLWKDLFGVDTPEGMIGDPSGGLAGSEEASEEAGSSSKVGEKVKASTEETVEDFKTLPKHCIPADSVPNAKRLSTYMLPIIRRATFLPDEIGRKGSLYIRRAIAGYADCFRQSVPANGKRNVYMLIDMSGSMCDRWSDGLSELVACFAILRDLNHINLKMYLTKGDGAGRHKCTEISSISPEAICRLEPDGSCECISQALETTKRDLVQSDVAFIVTDACICDTAVDPKFWRRQGVDLVGCCTSSGVATTSKIRRKMNEHFARSFITETCAQLARKMLSYAMDRKVRC